MVFIAMVWWNRISLAALGDISRQQWHTHGGKVVVVVVVMLS